MNSKKINDIYFLDSSLYDGHQGKALTTIVGAKKTFPCQPSPIKFTKFCPEMFFPDFLPDMYSGSLIMRRHSVSTKILEFATLTLTWRIKTYADEAFGRFPTCDVFGRTGKFQRCVFFTLKLDKYIQI